MITIPFVLRIVAIVCLFMAAVNVNSPKVNLTAAGLLFWLVSITVV